MPSSNKQVQLAKLDASSFLDELEVNDAPIPVPSSGEVLVHFRSRPIHPVDVLALKGYYQDMPQKNCLPFRALKGRLSLYSLARVLKICGSQRESISKLDQESFPLSTNNLKSGEARGRNTQPFRPQTWFLSPMQYLMTARLRPSLIRSLPC